MLFSGHQRLAWSARVFLGTPQLFSITSQWSSICSTILHFSIIATSIIHFKLDYLNSLYYNQSKSKNSVELFISSVATYRMTKHVVCATFCHYMSVDMNLVEHFSKESSESSRTFFGIHCQPSVMLNYQLDCAMLNSFQEFLHGPIVLKTLSLYLD